MRSIKMWEMTWPEIQAATEAQWGVLIPIGAIEQHGYHLPVSTDTILPVETALGIAQEIKMIVAPPIMYATNSRPLSGGGQLFPGTTSLRATTFMAQLEDVMRELIRSGFRKIVLLNWHMENSNFLYEAAYRITGPKSEDDLKIMILESPFDRFSEATMDYVYQGQFPGWSLEHAAVMETSLMLFLKPELVQTGKMIDDAPKEIAGYDILPIDERFVSKSGCLWKATLASKEKGAKIWQELKEILITAIAREFDVSLRREK